MLSLVIQPAEGVRPAEPDPSAPGVNIWRSADGQPVAFSTTQGDRRRLHWPGVATFEFIAGSDTVSATPHPPVRADLIHEAFQHSVLPLALQALGREAIHASAVLTPGGVVGFCGHAEAGKSTLAYALSERGYGAWSDDAVVFEVERHSPRAVRLPFAFRLRPASAAFFGRQPGLQRGFGHQEFQRAPLAALCVLTRSAADAPDFTITRLAGRDALQAVLEHALCFDWHDRASKQTLLVHYLTLASSIRVFAVGIQPSLERLSRVVDALVDLVIAKPPGIALANEITIAGTRPEPAGIGRLRG
jgi:hypothetical protein